MKPSKVLLHSESLFKKYLFNLPTKFKEKELIIRKVLTLLRFDKSSEFFWEKVLQCFPSNRIV